MSTGSHVSLMIASLIGRLDNVRRRHLILCPLPSDRNRGVNKLCVISGIQYCIGAFAKPLMTSSNFIFLEPIVVRCEPSDREVTKADR